MFVPLTYKAELATSQPVSRSVGQPIIQSLKIDEIDTLARGGLGPPKVGMLSAAKEARDVLKRP